MIDILIFTESRFPANRKKIRAFAARYLHHKISGQVELGINIVGDRKMKKLNSQYRHLEETCSVLAFPTHDPRGVSRGEIEAGFSPEKSSPDKILRLGDVVISYPQTVLLAAAGNCMVDKKMEELIAHGLDHLLGQQHQD